MATLENLPPGQVELRAEGGINPLNSVLARVYTLNWEAIFYIVLFVVAILTRFVNLGDRVMSHDESLHTKFSLDLYKNGTFQHTPLMHGPVLFHAIAFMYFLFGDSDFSARLYPAVLGVMLVLMPKVLFERWLGKLGSMVTSVLLLISPMILYHNRYIREDTPSIFFTLIMFYAIFRYVDGVRPKQPFWLLVMSGAMLLSLASKEVAFMYIAIFGSFLTLFWLVQVLQGLSRGETKPVIGWILGGILGLLTLGGAALVLGTPIAERFGLPRIVVQVMILALLAGVAYTFLKPIRSVLGELGWRAQTLMQTVVIGTVIGGFASLVMICIVNIIPLKDVFNTESPAPSNLLPTLILWTALLVIGLLVAVIGTALWGFMRSRRLPWVEIASILAIALIVSSGLVWAEERSKNAPNVSSDKPAAALDPNNPTATANTGIHNEPILIMWVIGAAACIGLIGLRFGTPFFEEMRRYPVFDALVVMGTLVLPWLTAIPMFMAGYQLDQYPASQEVINAGIASAIPFCAIAIVGGLCWNPSVWVACAVTFYSIFAFFFTTVFTNPQGIISGAIGSLGYWLAQQGVRRGSQPQYYYLLVELPVYEYLPVIGALIAGVVGLGSFWRFRAGRYAEEKIKRDDVINDENLINISTINAADVATMPDSLSPIEGMGSEVSDAEPPIDQTMLSHATEVMEAPIAPTEIEPERVVERGPEWLERLPFLGFFGYWTVLIIYAFTISGEKMPWLTTHLTLPMIFITGWYLGTVLEKVEWPTFFRQSWSLIILTPILVIALGNVFGPFLVGQRPFGGLERDQLLQTGTWLAALLIAFGILYAINQVLNRIGWRQTARVMFIGVFALLGLLTARTAWRFAYIDYDYATEFGVYAHGAPAVKTVMNKIEELSKQTTDSMNIKVAYDNDVSWPGSWYFRNYPQARFIGDAAGATDLDTFAAIVVSANHRATVEPQLGDRFYRFDFIRLWWPMQDYFDLNANRINNIFVSNTPEGGVDGAKLRQGLWDIWWNRDYKAYGEATSKNFDVAQWPVADRMVFFVRKDIAAQIWDLGVGGATASVIAPDTFANLRCDTCRADQVFGSTSAQNGQLDRPRGVAFAPNGNMYVADSRNARIVVLKPDGTFVTQFGTAADASKGAAPGGTFLEPWGVAVGKDGTVYVADTWNHRVQVFDANHNPLGMWGHFEQVAANQPGTSDGFWGPRDITVDDQDRIYVADTGNKRIRVYSKQGQLLNTIGGAGAGPGQLNEPVGLVIDPKTQRLFVADTWNKRIEVFDLNGTFFSSWPVPNWFGPSDDTGNRPYLTLDKTGTRLFAAEPDSGRILVWDVSNLTAQGGEQAILVFGSKGPADAGHFNILGGLATDSAGNLYAVDSGTSRILRFPPDKLPGVLVAPPLPIPQQPTQDATEAATKDAAF